MSMIEEVPVVLLCERIGAGAWTWPVSCSSLVVGVHDRFLSGEERLAGRKGLLPCRGSRLGVLNCEYLIRILAEAFMRVPVLVDARHLGLGRLAEVSQHVKISSGCRILLNLAHDVPCTFELLLLCTNVVLYFQLLLTLGERSHPEEGVSQAGTLFPVL